MPNPISDRRYPFSAAALASGASPKAIRNWIDKGQVPGLEADRERVTASWRRFSVFDIVKLAFIKRMVDFGVPVVFAAHVASGWLVSAMLLGSDYRNTPPGALSAHFNGAIGVIWRAPLDGDRRGGWDCRLLRMPENEGGIPAQDAWLRIDVGEVASSVVAILASLEGEDEE